MKIAFITPFMSIGGAETYIIAKAEWLVRKNHEVIIISSGGENVESLKSHIKHIYFPRLNDPPYYFSRAEYRKYINELKSVIIDNGVQIIETHNSYPCIHVYLAYPKHNVPFLVNILNELSYNNNYLLRIITPIIDKNHILYTLNKNMSSYINRKTAKKVSPMVVPIPMELPDLNYDDDHNDYYILTVSRMCKEKMYVLSLIEDFAQVIKIDKYSKLRLVVVGDGPLLSSVKLKAQKVNHLMKNDVIQIKGFVTGKELEDLYRNAFIVVSMGISMLKGVSYKKPVIIPGILKKDIEYGWGYWGNEAQDIDLLCSDGTSKERMDSYYNLIINILENKVNIETLTEKAYFMLESTFGYESIMNSWEKNYEKTLVAFNEKAVILPERNIKIIIGIFRLLYKAIDALKRRLKGINLQTLFKL